MPISVAIVLLSFSAHCALMWHHREHYPYSPSEQSGKSTPWCQRQSVPPCLANRNSPRLTSLQCYPVNYQPPPSLPPEPKPRESQPHKTTWYMVATGFLHPVEPQAPLPAGYHADYTNCTALHRVHGISCLAVHTVHTVHWTQSRQGMSLEAGRRLEEPQELRAHLFSTGGWHGRRSSRPRYILSPHGWPNGHSCNTAIIPPLPLGGAHILVQHTTCDLASTLWCACAVL